MTTQQAYTDWSETYDSDRNLTRDLDQLVTRASLSRLQCQSIVEIGCGTGKNTELLAGIGAAVCAIDFSKGMIGRARAKHRFDHVSFVVADLTQPWPCRDRSADLVVGNLVLEHIQDLAFIFSAAGRILRPGGRMFVAELHPFKQYLGSQAKFQRGSVEVKIPAFVHHISEFIDSAGRAGLTLVSFKEWWHETEPDLPPRLVSFLFEKQS